MKELGPPDTFYLSAAQGWLGLGNPAEARAEFSALSPRAREHPDSLEVDWQLNSLDENWDECLRLAEKILQRAPERAFGWIHAAYALHELKQTEAAYDLLKKVTDQFPECWLVHYNMACYCCTLGYLSEALDRIRAALKHGDVRQLKELALADADLEPLWLEIKDL
jgi:tetratricopeptide (TPR) repeat protein